uniref:Uncharacterized protein n=1 Tax=Glossina palpalis gambiensis TaxID=67801 RepID=A0A1B0AW77_9MUSC
GSLQKLNIYGNPDALSTTCKAPVKEKILSDNFLESGSSGLDLFEDGEIIDWGSSGVVCYKYLIIFVFIF